MRWILVLSVSVATFFAVFSTGCKKEERQPAIVFYQPGDYYNVGGEQAIVYKEVTLSGGMYALAVSLDEAELAWSTEEAQTGADDTDNGLKNQQKIEALAGWETKYPAFKWCADHNKNGSGGWYLPSAAEMVEVYNTGFPHPLSGAMTWLGDYIEERGGATFAEAGPGQDGIPPYWTSTEGSTEGFAVSMRYNPNNRVSYPKSGARKVRAVKYIRIY